MTRKRFSRARRTTRVVALLFALGLSMVACDVEPSRPPNLILVVIDTARADHFGSYGYPRDTTPNFDAFARDGIRFANAYSTSCWTLPSHASLFTGLLPATHGANQVTQILSQDFETLAERLSPNGYGTIAISNNSWVSLRTNVLQGFEHVHEMWRDSESRDNELEVHPTNQKVIDWLSSPESVEPFFMFVHYLEPHWPYSAPREFQDRFLGPQPNEKTRRRANFKVIDWYAKPRAFGEELLPIRESLYDAELFTTDVALGHLFDTLKEYGKWDDSLVVVTSDHGENLGERGHQGHSFMLYENTIRVPLAIKAPGRDRKHSAAVRDEPVQLTDVYATLLSASGVSGDVSRSDAVGRDSSLSVGRDLLAEGTLPDREIVAAYARPEQFMAHFPKFATQNNPLLETYQREIRSIMVGNDKLIWGSDGRHELYDLGASRGETEDRSREAPERVAELAARLQELRDRLTLPESGTKVAVPAMDESTEKNLRELGYIR